MEFTTKQVYTLLMAGILGSSGIAVTTLVLRWEEVNESERRQWEIIRNLQRRVDLLEYVVLNNANEEPSPTGSDARSGER